MQSPRYWLLACRIKESRSTFLANAEDDGGLLRHHLHIGVMIAMSVVCMMFGLFSDDIIMVFVTPMLFYASGTSTFPVCSS